jgi:hypothetical protein
MTLLTGLALTGGAALAEESPPNPDPKKLEAEGAVIGEIRLVKRDVFDNSNPKESAWFYRLANKLHIITRDSVIEKQLLLDAGDPYSKRLSDESERILRENNYFYDASIKPVNAHDGVVDLEVTTKDVWTLNPGFSFGRKGGENTSALNVEELNLFGYGQLVRFTRSEDVDRISKTVEYQNRHIGRSWVSGTALYSDNSDGKSTYVEAIRPFYALDTHWTAGAIYSDAELGETLYNLGERTAAFLEESHYVSAFGGWSAGLRGGWVRRYTTGFVVDENRFAEDPTSTLPPAVPENRRLAYPFLGIEILQNSFETTTNRDQIEKTEDYLTGTHFQASLGWSDERFGADRNALVYSASFSELFGSLDGAALQLFTDANGRLEHGATVNSLVNVDARYSYRESEKSTTFVSVSGTVGHNLDLDNHVELGGDTGLRGYPLRYQTGTSMVLLSAEQRYFTDWYPFRLVRVGAAVFADAGRTYGDHPFGGDELGWLRDVGIGLRIAPTRTGSGKIVHIDLAFPLDGDPSIDHVQLVIETKTSF